MPTSKPLFYDFTTRKKYRVPSRKFVEKKVLCEKGDEITRFDVSNHSNSQILSIKTHLFK